jgi:tetratricopeptide (TPR) repeat protein
MSDELSDRELAELLPLDGAPGPARAISEPEARAIVTSVIETADRGRKKSRSNLVPIAAALTIALGASLAVASFYAARRLEPPAVIAPKPQSTPETALEREPDPEPALEEDLEPEIDAESEPQTEPVFAPPKDRKTAEDLLERANRFRAERKPRVAEKIYLKVLRRFPQSDAAYVAAIATASIRLEELGNPQGALRLYRRAIALRPSGALDAEARFGLAEALRTIADPAEKEALRDFLSRHPSSPYATKAKKRLEELH